MALNDLEQRIGLHFALYYRIRQLLGELRKLAEDKSILSATEMFAKM